MKEIIPSLEFVEEISSLQSFIIALDTGFQV